MVKVRQEHEKNKREHKRMKTNNLVLNELTYELQKRSIYTDNKLR